MLILKAKTREELVKQIADWLMDQYRHGDAWCRLESGDDDNESNTCANVDGVINLNTLVDHVIEREESGGNYPMIDLLKKIAQERESGEPGIATPRESRGEGGYPIPRNPGTNRV